MGIINFSFVAPKSKKTKNKVDRPKKGKTRTKVVKHLFTIERDLECVIVEDNEVFGCNVIIEGNEMFVPIHKDCYETKGHSKLYRKINKMYITHIRSTDDELRSMPTYYLPFKPGIKVKANLVKDYDVYYIYIKRIYK